MSASAELAPNGPPDVATPAASPGYLSGPVVLATAARLGAWLASWTDQPFRLGTTVVAVKHAHVREMLARDLDFRIGPVNALRIEDVIPTAFIFDL